MIIKYLKWILLPLLSLVVACGSMPTEQELYGFNDGDSPVGFKGVINNSANIPNGSYVTVYTYVYREDFVKSKDYISTGGILNPENDRKLYLPSGEYEFYAVSIGNKSETPPSVNDTEYGLIENLSNGYDYLSASLFDVFVEAPETEVLNFKHECSLIKVNVLGLGTSVVESVQSAMISQPDPKGCEIDLFTGGVLSSTALASSQIAMDISGTECSQILLPLRYSGSLTLNLQVRMQGSSTVVTPPALSLPVLNDRFVAGSTYTYNVSVTNTTSKVVNFTSGIW